MSVAWFSYKNWVDLGATVITSDSEVSNMLASNVQKPQVAKFWRTSSHAAYILIDFGADKDVDVAAFVTPREIGLHAESLTPAMIQTDQVRHRGWADGLDPDVDGHTYSSGWINSNVHPRFGYHTHILSSTETVRYWRIDFDVTSREAGDDDFDVGRVWLGPRVTSDYFYAVGARFGWRESNISNEAPRSGIQYRGKTKRWRVGAFTFRHVLLTEADKFEDLDAYVGTSQQLVFGKEETGTLERDIMLGSLTSMSEAVHDRTNKVSKQYNFREDL